MKQNTQLKILEEAERCLQLKGYNGFSYNDLSNAIGIKTSSIHYHYPTKVDLVVAVIEFYTVGLLEELARISRTNKSTTKKLTDFINAIFSKTFSDNRKMCLGGILAAEVTDLDPKIHVKLKTFFDKIEIWIVSTIKESSIDEAANAKCMPEIFAKQLIIQIEGALILARLFDDDSYLSLINEFISLY
jgi:TetR/AcrR family transcriptional regulator, transcriptional repressor for nem operon